MGRLCLPGGLVAARRTGSMASRSRRELEHRSRRRRRSSPAKRYTSGRSRSCSETLRTEAEAFICSALEFSLVHGGRAALYGGKAAVEIGQRGGDFSKGVRMPV